MSTLDEKLELLAELEDRQRHLAAKIEALELEEHKRRDRVVEILQRITARLDERIEADRPRLEAMVREQYAGDERMTAIALEALEDELAKIPGLVLAELLEEIPKPEAMH